VQSPPRHFSVGPGPDLHPVDAVAALLVLRDGRYAMQLRDDRPDIIYPGHWGCFGGAVRQGEPPHEALRRELLEELEFSLMHAEPFASFGFDLTPAGLNRFYRVYFVVQISKEDADRFVLHEGAALGLFRAEELLIHERVSPHDAFALWLHASRSRLTSA
jgi:8-oxo-dGTP pyrophosphatase MutT (NUDIX family)